MQLLLHCAELSLVNRWLDKFHGQVSLTTQPGSPEETSHLLVAELVSVLFGTFLYTHNLASSDPLNPMSTAESHSLMAFCEKSSMRVTGLLTSSTDVSHTAVHDIILCVTIWCTMPGVLKISHVNFSRR